MTTLSSMQYTIGTALERARQAGSYVEVLVDNHWLNGLVVASDGLGVVLESHGDEHCVVRLECIAAVRVNAEAPTLRPIPSGEPLSPDRTFDGAMPMPSAHAACA